ncbi:hypothetical protein H4P55_003184 [Listeria monocytogenes]|nr:hypothetical protein [Listeria monocytogenes]
MMKRVLVLGANGQIARLARAELLEQEVEQVLFLRKASRIHVQNTDKEIVVLVSNLRQLFVETEIN